jgi:nucleotide sugar dehydrogenase
LNISQIAAHVERARGEGREVVVVLGLGFVGTAVAANLARALGPTGRKLFFVVGLDRDDAPGREKVARLDRGVPPTYANDPSLEQVVAAAAAEPRSVAGSVDPAVLRHAHVVISCINLDVRRKGGQTEALEVPTESYAAAMRMVGAHVRPGTLVCVESTLPLGMCDTVLLPALEQGFASQGVDTRAHPALLAYCYERVMPGPEFLDSVNNFWRAYAGTSELAADKARDFLSKYVNTAQYPLWRHKTTRAAEMGKLLENSYRATNIAFIEEWARLAEGAGVDLFDVIRSIRLRRGTHDNMMLPGLGVGGYCLTKDALLAAFGAENLVGIEAQMPFSRRAILTNERMPLRAVELIERRFGATLRGRKACLFGVTYRPGVADTRSSPSEIVARALDERGVSVTAYDPLIEAWEEFPAVRCLQDAEAALSGAEIVVVCLPDARYREFLPELLVRRMPPGSIVVDPWNMVADAAGARLATHGVKLEVFGRGDVPAPQTAAARKTGA